MLTAGSPGVPSPAGDTAAAEDVVDDEGSGGVPDDDGDEDGVF